MSRHPPNTAVPDDYTREPIYWFALLDKAIERGDHPAAAQAQKELERLGVNVRYGRPRNRTRPQSEGGRRHE